MINYNSEDYLIGKAAGIEDAVSQIDAASRVAFSAGDDHKANILRKMAKDLRHRAIQVRQLAALALKKTT